MEGERSISEKRNLKGKGGGEIGALLQGGRKKKKRVFLISGRKEERRVPWEERVEFQQKEGGRDDSFEGKKRKFAFFI